MVSVIDGNKKNVAPTLLFGSIFLVFGVSIYIGLPLAILTQNLSLMLQVFFFILLAMLFGLTLIVTNIQGLFEVVFSHLFLFWEKKSMMAILRKNMLAH